MLGARCVGRLTRDLHMHGYICTPTHARLHTCTPTHACPYMHAYTCMRAYALTHAGAFAHTRARSRAHGHIHAHLHMHPHSAHARVHVRVHMRHMQVRTHTDGTTCTAALHVGMCAHFRESRALEYCVPNSCPVLHAVRWSSPLVSSVLL